MTQQYLSSDVQTWTRAGNTATATATATASATAPALCGRCAVAGAAGCRPADYYAALIEYNKFRKIRRTGPPHHFASESVAVRGLEVVEISFYT